jgi:inner membrane protein
VDISSTGLLLIAGGLIIIAFEVVHPGAFLLIPGTIILVAGVLYTFVPDFLTGTIFGPLIVAAAAIIAGLVTIPYYMRLGRVHRPMTTTPESLEGELGVVISPVIPDSMRGKVRVRSEVWSARSEHPISVGTRVKVRGGQGVSVWVEPEEGSSVPTRTHT